MLIYSQDFKYAASEYGVECYCGNDYKKYGPVHRCNLPCKGNEKENCGGNWAMSVYRVGKLNGDGVSLFSIFLVLLSVLVVPKGGSVT